MTRAGARFRRILVPVNGSDLDESTVRLAATTAKEAGAELIVVSVVVVNRTLPLDADLPDATEATEAALERAERVARAVGVPYAIELLQARATGPAIVDEALTREVDLIVMSISYRKRFGEFYLGQTTPYVLKQAPCRVWVAREPNHTAAKDAT